MANALPTIIIATHGKMCTELVNAVTMLYGEQEGLIALPLLQGVSPEVYLDEMRAVAEKSKAGTIVLADLMGGTPFNTMMKLSRELTLYGAVGVNIPMVMELLDRRTTGGALEDIVAEAVATTKDSIMDVTAHLLKIRRASGQATA